MTQGRRRFVWLSCCLVSALTAGISGARAAGQTNDAPSPAAASTRTGAAAERPSVIAGEPPKRDDYERLPFMEQPRDEDGAQAPGAAGLLVRTLGALCLIVGLIAAAAWGLRRFGGAQFSGSSEDAPELTVLATLSLGNQRSLSAVRFGDRLLLIGSTAQAITLLATKGRRPDGAAPRMRSVADLLAEDEPHNFEQALTLADQRVEQRADTTTV
jgi:flagellar biosynthetic protein FliO